MSLFDQPYYSQMWLRIQACFYKYSFRLLTFIGCGVVVSTFSTCVKYGAPEADYLDVAGTVHSADSLLPIEGIKVGVANADSTYGQEALTDSLGRFYFGNIPQNSATYMLSCQDIDEAKNGRFVQKDTLVELSEYQYINLDINLDRKVE